jgi:hypothetical protein
MKGKGRNNGNKDATVCIVILSQNGTWLGTDGV